LVGRHFTKAVENVSFMMVFCRNRRASTALLLALLPSPGKPCHIPSKPTILKRGGLCSDSILRLESRPTVSFLLSAFPISAF
jgi:hypothetical protein